MQINFQQLSVGFARVCGEVGTLSLLNYIGILAQSSEIRAIVFFGICSDT
jgi:hypothetical protein